jgi:hypothetical protein
MLGNTYSVTPSVPTRRSLVIVVLACGEMFGGYSGKRFPSITGYHLTETDVSLLVEHFVGRMRRQKRESQPALFKTVWNFGSYRLCRGR